MAISAGIHTETIRSKKKLLWHKIMAVYVSCPKYPLYYKCKIYEKIVEELKKSGPIGCLLVLLSTLFKKKAE